MPRRTLRNTTALALGLSVALPHFTAAQVLAGDKAPLVLAQAEGAATAPVVVPPEAATPEPAGDPAESAAPEPAAQEAPAEAATAVEEPAAVPAPEPAAEAAPAIAEEPAAEAAPEAAASAEPAEQAAPEAQAPPVAEVAPEPEAEVAAEATAEPATPPAAIETPTPVQAPAEPEPAPTAEELAGEDAASTPAAEPKADARPVVAKEPAAPEELAPAESAAEAAPQPAATPAAPAATDLPSEADLARALAGEKDDKTPAKTGTEAAPAGAAATGGAPVVENVATPVPIQDNVATTTNVAPSEAGLAEALAGARAVPEAEARPTDAAREAAAAATAPAAAALADSATPVTTGDTRQVTDETTRSATEDFLTDLQGTLRQGDIPVVGGAAQQGGSAPVVVGADGQPATTEARQEADNDDDRSDLEKVLRQAVLPALAGLAVGQLLSNNRQVELNTGDRVVVTRPDGSQEIIKDDNALLLRPGSTVQNEEYADGSTRTIVTREDGSQVVTIRDADLRVLRRTLIRPDGTTTALIDETAAVAPVNVASLPPPARPIVVAPGQQLSEDALREALRQETQVNRTFTLGQIRNIPEVRALVAPVDIQAITFETGSAAIKPDQAQALSTLGRVIADSVRRNPAEIYMIEGHTDTVGADAMNLALSDRRAESVALALTEFFDVPPENMVVQGYGEQFLRVAQEGDVRANRRASVRRITDLLARN